MEILDTILQLFLSFLGCFIFVGILSMATLHLEHWKQDRRQGVKAS